MISKFKHRFAQILNIPKIDLILFVRKEEVIEEKVDEEEIIEDEEILGDEEK